MAAGLHRERRWSHDQAWCRGRRWSHDLPSLHHTSILHSLPCTTPPSSTPFPAPHLHPPLPSLHHTSILHSLSSTTPSSSIPFPAPHLHPPLPSLSLFCLLGILSDVVYGLVELLTLINFFKTTYSSSICYETLVSWIATLSLHYWFFLGERIRYIFNPMEIVVRAHTYRWCLKTNYLGQTILATAQMYRT